MRVISPSVTIPFNYAHYPIEIWLVVRPSSGGLEQCWHAWHGGQNQYSMLTQCSTTSTVSLSNPDSQANGSTSLSLIWVQVLWCTTTLLHLTHSWGLYFPWMHWHGTTKPKASSFLQRRTSCHSSTTTDFFLSFLDSWSLSLFFWRFVPNYLFSSVVSRVMIPGSDTRHLSIFPHHLQAPDCFLIRLDW